VCGARGDPNDVSRRGRKRGTWGARIFGNGCGVGGERRFRRFSFFSYSDPMFEVKVKWWYITSARFRPRGRTRGVVADKRKKANALSRVEERRAELARAPRAFHFHFPSLPRAAPPPLLFVSKKELLPLFTP
jgi:hypothetical protein